MNYHKVNIFIPKQERTTPSRAYFLCHWIPAYIWYDTSYTLLSVKVVLCDTLYPYISIHKWESSTNDFISGTSDVHGALSCYV